MQNGGRVSRIGDHNFERQRGVEALGQSLESGKHLFGGVMTSVEISADKARRQRGQTVRHVEGGCRVACL